MANYYATARTNYFEVKDPDKFKAFVAKMPDLVLIEKTVCDAKRKRTLYGFYVENPDGGGFPTVWATRKGQWQDVALCNATARHLKDGEIAIFVEAGHEKSRYVTGYAIAINSKGKSVELCIDNIYNMLDKLAPKGAVTRAEY